jgi:hypothetical protein
MPQGQATTSRAGSTKVEPTAKAVNLSAVAEIGVHEVRHTSVPLYEGRGLEAPMVGTDIHKSGSQGKHK